MVAVKKRITGRVNGDAYEVVGQDGSVVASYPLDAAKTDRKLKAAIERNAWEMVE